MTLKIYTQGERVLRIEAVAHNTEERDCGRSLEKFSEIVSRLRAILERFMEARSCVDQCFIAEETLEQLAAPSQVGRTKLGGMDFNPARIRRVAEAVLALSASPGGFSASQLAGHVRVQSGQSESQYGPRRAGYDLKKLRGKHMVRRIERTQRYEPIPDGLKALAALVVLRHKVIRPLLAGAVQSKPARGALHPRPIDGHYETIRKGMLGLFHELGLAA